MDPQQVITPDPIAPASPVIPTAAEGSKPSHFLPIILSSLITALILVVIYFIFFNKSPKFISINSSPTPAINAARTWGSYQTFTNSKFGISVSYPMNLKLVENYRGENQDIFGVFFNDELNPHIHIDINEITHNENISGLNINDYVDSLGSPNISMFELSNESLQIINKKTTSVGNKMVLTANITNRGESLEYPYGLISINGKKMYELICSYKDSGEKEIAQKYFNQIISDLQFTN